MRSHAPRLLVAAAVALTSLAPVALAAPSPIKSEKKLKSELAKAEKKLVKSHLRLGKQMKREKKNWAAYLELISAKRLDPTNKKFLKLLPETPPAPEDLEKAYTKARSDIDFEATQALSSILERAVEGELSEAALAPLALRILTYEPDRGLARKALGFDGEKGSWRSGHERRLTSLYRAGYAKLPAAKPLEENPFPKLEEAMGFKLTVFEGLHSYAVCDASTPMPKRLIAICKAADLTYEAIHYDLFGVSELLTPEGKAAPTGEQPKPLPKFIFLQLNGHAQHMTYLEKVVTDPNVKVVGKTLGMVVAPWKPQKTLICDCWSPGFEKEWPADRMARFVVGARFGGGRSPYLLQGIARYYSGHVSGMARMRTVPVGSKTKGQRTYKAGTYGQLRDDVRADYNAFRIPLPLSGGLFKDDDSMVRGDNAMASAFVDYLIANDKAKLRDLLAKGDNTKVQVPALIKEVFGDTASTVDEAFGQWFERNY